MVGKLRKVESDREESERERKVKERAEGDEDWDESIDKT